MLHSQNFYKNKSKHKPSGLLRWPPRVTLGRLLPHARGLGFKPRRGGLPSGAKKEWGLSPKGKDSGMRVAADEGVACGRAGGMDDRLFWGL
nr:hypothetical protein [Tanacetum cinerariifolium]